MYVHIWCMLSECNKNLWNLWIQCNISHQFLKCANVSCLHMLVSWNLSPPFLSHSQSAFTVSFVSLCFLLPFCLFLVFSLLCCLSAAESMHLLCKASMFMMWICSANVVNKRIVSRSPSWRSVTQCAPGLPHSIQSVDTNESQKPCWRNSREALFAAFLVQLHFNAPAHLAFTSYEVYNSSICGFSFSSLILFFLIFLVVL